MNQPKESGANEPSRKVANSLIEWVFFHLIKEVRELGLKETPKSLPAFTQSTLLQAELGAIAEVASYLAGVEWVEDWEVNAKAWALQSVLGDQELSRAKAELERAASPSDNELSQFTLCGILAARHLIQSLGEGTKYEEWLERYEGTFAAMTRLFDRAA